MQSLENIAADFHLNPEEYPSPGDVSPKMSTNWPFIVILQLRPGEIINGKYCECSNMECPSDPDTDLLCGGEETLLNHFFVSLYIYVFFTLSFSL